MNAQEQRLRHTAVSELREEVGTIVDALLKTVGQQLEQERQAWIRRANELEEQITAESEGGIALGQSVVQLRSQVIAINEWINKNVDSPCYRAYGFWRRLRWLVTGR